MPYDIIKMHAGLLSRQIRNHFYAKNAIIKIFQHNNKTGEICSYEKNPVETSKKQVGDWSIIYDDETLEKISKLRNENLPNETGGIIVGYFDQKMKRIYVVDALSSPLDSVQEKNFFKRGVLGLKQELENISKRTSHIVNYIGEWHSHPQGNSAYPSDMDIKLLASLREQMNEDGLPIIMFIAGDNNFHLCLGGVNE